MLYFFWILYGSGPCNDSVAEICSQMLTSGVRVHSLCSVTHHNLLPYCILHTVSLPCTVSICLWSQVGWRLSQEQGANSTPGQSKASESDASSKWDLLPMVAPLGDADLHVLLLAGLMCKEFPVAQSFVTCLVLR